eukprot:GHVN01084009.1.p1 GENE.GHVN01084009.1~~GHVN01084009.1.p1  ORF type:complete len:353 (+),score=39.79 GHVN01084009.1:171-1229(+)
MKKGFLCLMLLETMLAASEELGKKFYSRGSKKRKHGRYHSHSNSANESLHYRKKNHCAGKENHSDYIKNGEPYSPYWGYGAVQPPYMPALYNGCGQNRNQGVPLGGVQANEVVRGLNGTAQENAFGAQNMSWMQNGVEKTPSDRTFFQWLEYMKMYENLVGSRKKVKVVRMENNGMNMNSAKLCAREHKDGDEMSLYSSELAEEYHGAIMETIDKAEEEMESAKTEIKKGENNKKTIREQILLFLNMLGGNYNEYLERIYDMAEEEKMLFRKEVLRIQKSMQRTDNKERRALIEEMNRLTAEYIGKERQKALRIKRLQQIRECVIGMVRERLDSGGKRAGMEGIYTKLEESI